MIVFDHQFDPSEQPLPLAPVRHGHTQQDQGEDKDHTADPRGCAMGFVPDPSQDDPKHERGESVEYGESLRAGDPL